MVLCLAKVKGYQKINRNKSSLALNKPEKHVTFIIIFVAHIKIKVTLKIITASQSMNKTK